MKVRITGCILFLVVIMVTARIGRAGEQFRIAIMQDQKGAAQRFMPVLEYLKKKGIDATFVAAPDYPAAAGMFSIGTVDGMFSGSGVAGFLILKDLAQPLVRPVNKNGQSTYWAVIIARKGAPKFTGSANYFRGKKVVFTTLSSSGDFYFHALPDARTVTTTEVKAASHGDAIEALHKGEAEIAIVKNRVWDAVKDTYPDLVKVGEDRGENPDNTLIVSKRIQPALAARVSDALLAIRNDTSVEAMEVKASLGIQGYIKTTTKDFNHTLVLLNKADVSKRLHM